MADLIAIGYPDQTTAMAAADEARQLAKDLIIEPDAIAVIVRDVLKTSLSKEGEMDLQEALHGGSAG
ncbi:MAG: hypothetical protein ACLQB1_16430 [Streptosporangiaceae bacterium]